MLFLDVNNRTGESYETVTSGGNDSFTTVSDDGLIVLSIVCPLSDSYMQVIRGFKCSSDNLDDIFGIIAFLTVVAFVDEDRVKSRRAFERLLQKSVAAGYCLHCLNIPFKQ